MKKWVIWFLVAVMALTFASLLTLQYSYIHTLIDTRKEQFNEAVNRSLFQVIKNLELDETARFLEENLEEKEKNTMQSSGFNSNIILKKSSSRLLSIGSNNTFSSVWEYEQNFTLSQTGPQVFISCTKKIP
jgi:hypothetical protein